jgi:hypothetical protein
MGSDFISMVYSDRIHPAAGTQAEPAFNLGPRRPLLVPHFLQEPNLFWIPEFSAEQPLEIASCSPAHALIVTRKGRMSSDVRSELLMLTERNHALEQFRAYAN